MDFEDASTQDLLGHDSISKVIVVLSMYTYYSAGRRIEEMSAVQSDIF